MKINQVLLEDALHIKLNISHSLAAYHAKSIMVTSAVHKEGSTCLAINLALAFALDDKSEILLVDANLRSPRLHDLFHLKRDHGFLDYMSGNAKLHETIKETQFPNIKVITAGQGAEDYVVKPLAAISQTMKTSFEKDFEWVIYDTAPVNHYPDTPMLTRLADGIILVIKAEHTSNKEMKKAKKNLEVLEACILGGVLNEFQ